MAAYYAYPELDQKMDKTDNQKDDGWLVIQTLVMQVASAALLSLLLEYLEDLLSLSGLNADWLAEGLCTRIDGETDQAGRASIDNVGCGTKLNMSRSASWAEW